jgi:hypothetical protein
MFSRDTAWHTLPDSGGSKSDSSLDRALYTRKEERDKKGGGRRGGRKRGGGGDKSRGGEKSGGNKQEKPTEGRYACFNCGKRDHKMWDCPKPISVKARKKANEKAEERREKEGKREKEMATLAIATPLTFISVYSPANSTSTPFNTTQLTSGAKSPSVLEYLDCLDDPLDSLDISLESPSTPTLTTTWTLLSNLVDQL